jgi:hypothetical protein
MEKQRHLVADPRVNSTVATSVVRMAYLPSLLKATDVPWVAAPANVWSCVAYFLAYVVP